MDDATARQLAIYEFILEEIAENFCPPTVRMIQERFGISSPNGVCGHLRALVRKGYLRRSRQGGPYVPTKSANVCPVCGADRREQ